MTGKTMKYVRLKDVNSIIVFPQIIQHSTFRGLEPISAGFCYFGSKKVQCYGQSISLNLKALPEDTELATRQFFEVV